MNIINTVEGLGSIVSRGGKVAKNPTIGSRRIIVEGGLVDLRGVVIEGLGIIFDNCVLYGDIQEEDFRNCNISIGNSEIQSVQFVNTMLRIHDSEVSHTTIENGSLCVASEVKWDYSKLEPSTLLAEEQVVLDILQGNNIISDHAVLENVTATCSNFGTYRGNVHYFKDSDTVIAGCWEGKLQEFKDKAESQGVAKAKYEAVYNYFKSFN